MEREGERKRERERIIWYKRWYVFIETLHLRCFICKVVIAVY